MVFRHLRRVADVLTSAPFAEIRDCDWAPSWSHRQEKPLVVKLRLKRFGRLNHATYRVSVIDGHKPRDGRVIETLGYYLPKAKKPDDQLGLNIERAEYWMSVGAQPSETVASLIKRAGGTIPVPKTRVRKKGKGKAKPFVPPRRSAKRKKAVAAPAAGAEAPADGAPASDASPAPE